MRGRLAGATAQAVTQELESQGLLALNVEEAADRAAAGSSFGFGRRRAILEYTRAVAALLPAGMPIARALAAATSTAPANVRPALDTVRARVERGEEIADVLQEYPRLFSPLYVGVIRAGEKSGDLDAAFERLATYLEREDELRSKLVSMSIYPALLAVVGIAAVLVLVLFVLPRFAELLESSGAAMPATTAAVLGIADAARANWQVLLAIPPVLIVLFAWLRTTDAGKRAASYLMVVTPIVGSWRKQALGAAFARMVGVLLAGGAPLLAALADARSCMIDPLARDETERIRTRVREGGSLHGAISENKLFPVVLAQLTSIGEESGRLADFLLKAAELLERRTERAVERLVALAEPAMIVGFGGLVAFVALSLLQAIYGINAGGL